MKNRKLFWIHFVMLSGPLCLYGSVIAMLILAFSCHGRDVSWIATPLKKGAPLIVAYWLVAAILNVVRYVMAFANKDLEDGDSFALHYANLLNVPLLVLFLVNSGKAIPFLLRKLAELIF